MVVAIPAFNESSSIAMVIREIPRDCCEEVLVIVVDDGSTDGTREAALEAGAARVISFKKHRGLASAFKAGLEAGLEAGADVIVNTDADGQYDGREIPALISPIRAGSADVVLGSRMMGTIEDMPWQKRLGNRIATAVTALACGQHVTDAQTGFRAFSREAALRLNVLSGYTYVQETLIHLANQGFVIREVPITFRKRMYGKSRLVSNIFSYALQAGTTIVRTYRDYHPVETFLALGCVFVAGGLALDLLQKDLFALAGNPLALLLIVLGLNSFLLCIVADMISNQRKVADEALYRTKRVEYRK